MGMAHYDAFDFIGCDPVVVTRSGALRAAKNKKVFSTKFSSVNLGEIKGGVVVALPILMQFDLIHALLAAKPRLDFLLIEKPVSFAIDDLIKISRLANEFNNIFVGYNRRFFGSIQALKQKIEEQGCSSIRLDVSENITRMMNLVDDRAVLKEWQSANSTHVLDLLSFFFPIKFSRVENF